MRLGLVAPNQLTRKYLQLAARDAAGVLACWRHGEKVPAQQSAALITLGPAGGAPWATTGHAGRAAHRSRGRLGEGGQRAWSRGYRAPAGRAGGVAVSCR